MNNDGESKLSDFANPCNYLLDSILSKEAAYHSSKYHFKQDGLRAGCPTITLANANVKLERVNKTLARRKTKASIEKQQILREYGDLERKEKSFRDNFKKFNEFVKNNRAKQERLRDVTIVEMKRDKEYEAKLESLFAKFLYFSQVKTKIEQKIKEHSIYEKYLWKICDLTESFTVSYDVVDRFITLIENKELLEYTGMKCQQDVLDSSGQFRQLVRDKIIEIIGLKTRLNEITERHEAARRVTYKCEEIIQSIQERAAERLKEISGCNEAIYSIYSNIYRNMKFPERRYGKGYTQKHLAYIKRHLDQLRKMRRTLRKIARQADTVSLKSTKTL